MAPFPSRRGGGDSEDPSTPFRHVAGPLRRAWYRVDDTSEDESAKAATEAAALHALTWMERHDLSGLWTRDAISEATLHYLEGRASGDLAFRVAGGRTVLHIDTGVVEKGLHGNTYPLTIPVPPDDVSLSHAYSMPLRIVVAHGVRAVVIDDLVAAFPLSAALITRSLDHVDRSIHFAVVALRAGDLEELVEVVALKWLFRLALETRFDQPCGETSFRCWAAEHLEYLVLSQPSRFVPGLSSRRPRSAALQAFASTQFCVARPVVWREVVFDLFPSFDPAYMLDYQPPIPYRPETIAFSRRPMASIAWPSPSSGKSVATPQPTEVASTAPVPSNVFVYAGFRITTKYRLPYVWAGSIAERLRPLLGDGAVLALTTVVADLQAVVAAGDHLPISPIDLATVGAPGSFQGRVVPWILRRQCDADVSRTPITRGWIQAGVFGAALAAVREEVARRPDVDLDALAAFDAFVAGDVAALFDHLDESGPDAPSASSPTESGEEVVIPMTFVRGEERRDFEVVFDKVLRVPWLSVEQLAFIQGMDIEALRRQLHRYTQAGTATDRDVKTATSSIGSRQRRARAFVSWDFASHVLMAKTRRRREAVADVVLQASRTCSGVETTIPIVSANLL